MPRLCIPCLALLAVLFAAPAQEPQKPAEPEKTLPAQVQITLLETSVRFENNGDSRKEVHCIVKINSEVGVRQFARLNFDYNRSFQQIEIPFVRVTHSSGGTADILPGAISDNPNPAVVNFPAYHDVRVKSVRILGLAPSDTLEYRVITTTTHHPLAPDFWLDHTFDRSGIVSHELFTLDLPVSNPASTSDLPDLASPEIEMPPWYRPSLARIRLGSGAPEPTSESVGEGNAKRVLYRWDFQQIATKNSVPAAAGHADVSVSTFYSWRNLGGRLLTHLLPLGRSIVELTEKSRQLRAVSPSNSPFEPIYAFVSQKIRTVDLPLGSTGFQLRDPSEVMSSGYGTQEDKARLFGALSRTIYRSYYLLLVGSPTPAPEDLPNPVRFSHLLIQALPDNATPFTLDSSVEVAPFGLVPSEYRNKSAFKLQELLSTPPSDWWTRIPDILPFQALQTVAIDAKISDGGSLVAKVKYTMRGDNELLLRVAFHQSPHEKWPEVAQLLSLSDGFRGKVTSVTASDPYATHDPFNIEYEISQPKFVDWSKKPVRIPAVLPLVGLPDPPADAKSPIELGTPLDVQTSVTLHLPPGTTVESPAGTTVDRDYATFSSQYAASGNTITATRHIHFIAREVPAARAADYNAFVRAVQNDQSQLFRLTAQTNASK